MAKIGIFYGSTAGVTEEIAEKLVEYFDEDVCALYNMEEDFDDFDDMLQYDYLLLGSSTWGSGEVQNDWRDPLVDMEEEKPDFTGKTVAFFWCRRLWDSWREFCQCFRNFIRPFQSSRCNHSRGCSY